MKNLLKGTAFIVLILLFMPLVSHASDMPGDLNSDGLVDAGDVPVYGAAQAGPVLSIPTGIPADAGQTMIVVPVDFFGDGNTISSMTFSIDYDETLLTPNPFSEAAVVVNAPAGFNPVVTFDETDTDGEIDIALFSFSAGLPDGTFVEITFDAAVVSSPTTAAVNFSQNPTATFGNLAGQDVPGSTVNGSVLISPNIETDCFDGQDNDGDGLTDCEDPDCDGATGGSCDTGQECTTGTRTCQGNSEVCVAANVPAGTACDDGLFCTEGETCDSNGVCQGGTPIDCSDGISCTVGTCDEAIDACVFTPDDGLCDNGEFCDGVETCDPNNDCQAGTPPCDPATESCDEGNDVCVPLPTGCASEPDPDGFCDDGDFCNGAETCDLGTGDCQAGTPVDCNDGVSCTVDSCNEGTDSCDNVPDDGLCDNGEFCDGVETCDPNNDCQAGTPPCDPATESCDEGNDVCVPLPTGCAAEPDPDGFCDDGDFCNGAETCDLGTGDCQAGTPVDCNDGVSCTVDSCNEGTDSCDNVPDDGLCDNGEFCDGSETCDPVDDCQAGTPPCDPATESCDEGNDVCVPLPTGCAAEPDPDGFCDDGDFCNGAETCDLGTGDCQAGTPVDCNDGVSCTVDSCNEGTDSCDNVPDDGLCDNGEFCDGSETCDPVDDCQAGTAPCDPATESCDEGNDVCVPLPTGCAAEPDPDGFCDDGDFCNGAETCDLGTGDCQAGTPVDCNDGVSCTVDSCNEGTDSCDNVPDDGLCDNGEFCDGSETCDPVDDCQAGTAPCDPATESCDEGNDVCVPLPTGCASEPDPDGFCDDGDFCNGAETCDLGTGDCQAGTPVDCNDGVSCTVDSCNEGTDSCDNVPDDGLCDNGEFCDGTETCDPVDDCQAGTAPCDPATESCDEGNDVCVPLPTGCASEPDPDGFCDDGDFCNGAETCDLGTGDCQAGTPVDCNDGVSCTVDSCNEGTDSCDNVPDDGLCDNGEFCDGSETCDPVDDCQAGTAPCDPATESCDEGNDVCVPLPTGCASEPDPDGFCDDGDFCNGAETCDLGTGDCQAGTPVDCNDGVSCTVDSCNEGTDSCDNVPDDGLCDNGEFCDGSETCDPVDDCQAGTAPCDPATESCDEGNDVCVPLPTGCASEPDPDGFCDDGDFCNGAETCDLGTGDCQAGTPVDCNDGVSCTVDSCNEGTDSCDNVPDDGLCDNGEFCDGSETCDPVDDCQAGTAPCDPATESCDEGNDVCVPLPTGCASEPDPDGFCDDGDFCNGAETCDLGTGDCQAGTPVDCNDGVSCTVDSCNEGTDSCDNVPDDGLCDNGEFCDGSETCDPVDDCQAGTAPCDPATESCDEGNDVCVPLPTGCASEPDPDGFCDDGDFCNGAETCDLGTGDCQAGTPVDCNDGVSCTVDSCNEDTDSCDNVPDDGLCDNGQFCDGMETCDPNNDCQAGTDPCAEGEICDEEDDTCESEELELINDHVSFVPIWTTFSTTRDTSGCPEGFVGIFSFEARLKNRSDDTLSSIINEVAKLTGMNLLQNADGGPGGEGALLTVPLKDEYSDGELASGETVDVPFNICLKTFNSFLFFVDVFGMVD